MSRPRQAITLYPLAANQAEIVVHNIVKRFGEKTVLQGISFEIKAGEMVAIVGASGGGKTVLLDHLTGLMAPTEGSVRVADHTVKETPLVDLNGINEDRLDLVRLAWAIVFQRNALFSGTVQDNIALWLREHSGLTDAEIVARVRESIKAAALDVDDVINKDRDSLSGGMAKRVAIARAIASDPLVLFYDEPTTGLDPVISAHIHDLIWNIHHTPRAVDHSSVAADQIDGPNAPAAPDASVRPATRTSIIVSHDRELLRRISPRVIMLEAGKVIFDGDYEGFVKCKHPTAQQYLRVMPELHGRDRG